MKLAVVAYPRLDEDDRQRIESFRARHDPQASRVALHFTLVFPVEGVPGDLGPEIGAAARSFEPFPFAIRRTATVADLEGEGCHIFLVPDEGGENVRALHDRLYAGALRPHLRSDIPFVPHMTIGWAQDADTAKRRAEAFGVRSRNVLGRVEAIEVVEVGQGPVRSVATYNLGKY